MPSASWTDLPADVLATLRRGCVLPAHPLALDERRQFDRRSQQALSRLGSVATQARLAMTVGPGGQFATLTDAFTALDAVEDVSLALLPGVQTLTANVNVANKRSIRITGASAYASRINTTAQFNLSAREVILNDVALVAQGRGHLLLQADRVSARNNAFARATTLSRATRSLRPWSCCPCSRRRSSYTTACDPAGTGIAGWR